MAASRFAGGFNAFDYAYGINPSTPPLQVVSGSTATSSSYTITVAGGYSNTPDGVNFVPFATNASILIGEGSQAETVTPSAVSVTTPLSYGTTTATATFTYAHGLGDNVRSGTVGLQEALNFVSGYGGGNVIIDARWVQYGGTQAMINAAVIPLNVGIIDSTKSFIVPVLNAPSSLTQISVPTALTTATSTYGMITTATTGGSIPASSTYRLAVTYVDIFGGETTISTDSASTSTIASGATSTNTITVTSPAASTGAVGYRVYMSAASGAAASEILYPVGNSAITGTTSTLGSVVPSFAIGTPVTITAIITGTATVPSVNTAYAAAAIESFAPVVRSYPPFPSLASIAAAATGTLGTINIPAGYLNAIGRTFRLKGMFYATTNSTPGTLTLKIGVASIPGVTSITPFSVVSGTTTASAVVSGIFEAVFTTASTGTSGTLEVHGSVLYNLAGTVVSSATQDIIVAVSSTVDLTKQDQIQIQLLCTTTATTTTQLRQLTFEVIQ